MKKNIRFLFIGMLTFIFLFIFSSNVLAASAYSIGSLYATGTGHDGDDFTTNVLNAQNAYSIISDINSYYNLSPTYSFLRSTSVLGNSRVFFINGHANNLVITVAGQNSNSYKTGISVYADGATSSSGYTYAGLDGRNMNNTRLITFAGCETAGYVGNANNLTDKAVAQGAQAALGWYEAIYSRFYYGPEWLLTYNNSLGLGYTLMNSIYRAKVAYPASNLSDYYATRGNTNVVIGTPTAYASLNADFNNDVIDANEELLKPVHETYTLVSNNIIKLDVINTKIRNENLKKHELLFKDIIQEIKTVDSEFDSNDYRVTYHLADEMAGDGDIYFRYYINDQIETNKVYLATLDNFEVVNITLAGVKIKNIQNVKKLNISTLNTKLEKFKKNKSEILSEKLQEKMVNPISILKADGSLEKQSFTNNILEAGELYYYDYNSNELKYILKLLKTDIDNTYNADGFELILNK